IAVRIWVWVCFYVFPAFAFEPFYIVVPIDLAFGFFKVFFPCGCIPDTLDGPNLGELLRSTARGSGFTRIVVAARAITTLFPFVSPFVKIGSALVGKELISASAGTRNPSGALPFLG